MVDKLREAYRLISLWAYEDIRNLSLCTIIRCNKIKRPSLAHSQWPIKRQKYFLLFLPCWLFLAEIEREVHPGGRTMEHEPAIYQYPIANNQWKVRSTSNFSLLTGYSLLHLMENLVPDRNKKKTDPNPPVWTGLNEKSTFDVLYCH